MKVRSTSGAQRARLQRTLLAILGALAMSIVMCVLWWRGDTRLSASGLVAIMVAFWIGNLGVPAIILGNVNLRFKDPSMTMAQMLWATVSSFTLVHFVTEGRYLLIMIYLLAMMFGTFRLTLLQLLVVALTALGSYAVVIALSAWHYPASFDLTGECLNWAVLSFVMAGFSVLGGQASRLRTTLEHRNRELRAATDASEIAFQAKTRFLASTSHELRTPLNTMIGATEIIEEANLNPAHRDALNRAHYAGRHLLSLVNTMIDLSRIESGALQLRLLPMQLVEELNGLHAMLSDEATDRGVLLSLDTNKLPLTPVMGDAMRIQAVLLNLLKVAMSHPTTHEVHFGAHQSPASDIVKFFVSRIDDEHKGAPLEIDDGLLQENFSIELCTQVIAVMGGELVISRVSDRGIRFAFDVHMSEAVENGAASESTNRRKMLIVDDSIDNRMLLQTYLKDQPWELRFAEDGVEAIAEVEKQAFDLILMDMHMPRMNGIDATRTIRTMEKSQPTRARSVIFAVTADDSVHDHRRSLEAGCDNHLVKPLSKKTLLRALAET